MWTYVILILTAVYLLYRWLTSKYNYFVERGIPAMKPKFPFGNTPNILLQKRNFTYDIDDIYQEFRNKVNYAGYFEAGNPKLLLISPETVKDVLVRNFSNFHDNEFSHSFNKETDPIFGRNPFMLRGEEWKEKRAEVTPAFTASRLRALFPLVEEVLERFKTYVNKEIPKNQPFDAREICAKFTTDVVSSCIFNADAQSFTKENPEIREMGKKIMDFGAFVMIKFMLLAAFPILNKMKVFSFVKKEVNDFFINIMDQAITLREKSGIVRDDYLAYLIELKKKKSLAGIDLAAHGVTFFTDGFETSSLAIAYTLYEIANDKRVQQKLRKQINDELIDENGKIIYEKMLEHEYLDQVFHEALRVHPILSMYNRECTEEIMLDSGNGKNCKIEKGMSVYVPIYSIQRDPDYYTNPDEFIPERFDPENGGVKEFRNRGVLMPFGDGSRICLGMRFALMQSKAAIVQIVRNFELSVDDKTQRPLVLDPKAFVNFVQGGLWLNMKAI